MSFNLWSDVFNVTKEGVIEDCRPGKAWFLYGFLVMDFLVGSLQVYWAFFGIILKFFSKLSNRGDENMPRMDLCRLVFSEYFSFLLGVPYIIGKREGQ